MYLIYIKILLRASQCLLMAGGVRWRKFGIFISSALANLPGGVFPGLTKPWCRGRGTLAGWKDLATGHTEGQSWSTGILWLLGGGVRLFQAGIFLLRFLSFLSRDFDNSNTLNCSSPRRKRKPAWHSKSYFWTISIMGKSNVYNIYQSEQLHLLIYQEKHNLRMFGT